MKTKLLLQAAIAAAIFVLQACGSDEPDEPAPVPGTDEPTQTIDVRVMSCNIRVCPTYDSYFDGDNNWRYRKEELIKVIKDQTPDIIGMQEVLYNQLNDVKPAFDDDYIAFGVGGDDGDTNGCFNELFVSRKRFDIIDNGYFWLSDTPDKPSTGWGAYDYRTAVWAKLKDKETDKILLAVNTHLDHQSADARVKGAILVLDSIQSMINEGNVVLTGDFNSSKSDLAIQTITTNMFGSFHLTDSRTIAEAKDGPEWTYHGWGSLIASNECTLIDFVFVGGNIGCAKHTHLDTTYGDGRYPTDHLPVVADLTVK